MEREQYDYHFDDKISGWRKDRQKWEKGKEEDEIRDFSSSLSEKIV